MTEIHLFLDNTWFFLLGLILVLYVVTDGFDLGIGILSLFEPDAGSFEQMMASIHGIWDANETWLVLFGGALFGAFPAVYAMALQALYIPITTMIAGLILRGMAIGLYHRSVHIRLWRLLFGAGSLLAAVAQGIVLGGMIGGLPGPAATTTLANWFWFTPFTLVVVSGVVSGYVLLGTSYLVDRTTVVLRTRLCKVAWLSSWMMLAAALMITVLTPIHQPSIAEKWFSDGQWLWLAPLFAVALYAFFRLQAALHGERGHSAFAWSLVIFIVSFTGLALSLYPYLIPGRLDIVTASASTESQLLMLVGIGLLIPVMLIYNGYQYLVFRQHDRQHEDSIPCDRHAIQARDPRTH